MSAAIVGRVYRHYKGGVYRVLDTSVKITDPHPDTPAVYYEHQSGSTYCRPHSDWASVVLVTGEHPTGIERFVLLPPGSPEERLFERAG